MIRIIRLSLFLFILNKLNKVLLYILLLLVCIASLFVGVKEISLQNLISFSEEELFVLFKSRVPRTIALVLTGVGLSISGFIMQQISQNKFVSPSTAGTLDAAKLGILFSILWFPLGSALEKTLFALVFTLAASMIFITMVRRIQIKNVILVPLIGIMFGSILNAIATFFAYKNNIVQNVQGWLLGDFSGILEGNYEAVYFILPAVILSYIYANQFVIVGMGESFSKNLGLNYNAIVGIGLFCISLTVSVTVVTVGAIPFLGLIIPNMVSMIYGDNLKKTLPYTALIGAIFIVCCDILGRLILYPYEIPIGLTVGILGGIFFFYLIFKRK